MSNYTKGPWFADTDGHIWRRPIEQLYQNGGPVAGDKPVATVHTGWFHEGAVGYPMAENAALIAAAPELLSACKAVLAFVDMDEFWAGQLRDAIAKAEGK